MNIKWQTIILIAAILFSLKFGKVVTAPEENQLEMVNYQLTGNNQPALLIANNFDWQKDLSMLSTQSTNEQKKPNRKWDVLDPNVSAAAVLIQSLEDNFSFFRFKTNKDWPMASLTKLMTALAVIEDIGLNKKIPISSQAVAVLGTAGGLREGEIYSVYDLTRIMLMTSSNDAAAAFEEYVGGTEAMAKLLNQKAAVLNMNQTIFHDGSGLSDLNQTSADDLFKLLKYIIQKQPAILSWTRLNNFLVQPLESQENSRLIENINSLIGNPDFLGGKTGTSDEAKQNLAAVFSLNNQRTAVIVLGSDNRFQEAIDILNWVKKAYEF